MFKGCIRFVITVSILGGFCESVPSRVLAQQQADFYVPTWESVNTHNPAPEWFKDAKFGIYFHWGVFSVPAYINEWYPRHMYRNGSAEYNHHLAVFGDPYSNWPYHNFIEGAYDRSGRWNQFAPQLVSQGGKFDPQEWAQLFKDSGARFAGPVAEHHDGFSMWNSRVNEWNSVTKSPHIDLAKAFASAIRGQNLKFMMSMHHAFNSTGFFQYVPQQSDASLRKLYGQMSRSEADQLWYDKLKEIIDQYQPDLIWQDFDLSKISESQRLNFLSYYYNKGIEWGRDVVATYKDGLNNRGQVYDYERGGPAELTHPYWLTDDSISSTSWCYTAGIGYYSTKVMLNSMVDRISKNGSVLLNIAPKADGTIPEGQKSVLLGMGQWLQVFGEAIYGTRAWVSYGEGPTKMGGGSFSGPIAGTYQDIRFTRNKSNDTLYAIGLGWPSSNQMLITSLSRGAFDASSISQVSFVGDGRNLNWYQDSSGLRIDVHPNLANQMGYAIKIKFYGDIPTPKKVATFFRDIDYKGPVVSLSAGDYTLSQLEAAGIPNNWISSLKVPEGLMVLAYADDNFSGRVWSFTASNADLFSVDANDVFSSMRIKPAVTFYRDYEYGGPSITLAPGRYTQSQIEAAGIPNNWVSAIKVPNGIRVIVYDGDNFSGGSCTFTENNANFGSLGCNDIMSSVVISEQE